MLNHWHYRIWQVTHLRIKGSLNYRQNVSKISVHYSQHTKNLIQVSNTINTRLRELMIDSAGIRTDVNDGITNLLVSNAVPQPHSWGN